VSRSVITGGLPAIVTGGFRVISFLPRSCGFGTFCLHEKIMEIAISKKHPHKKVRYVMFIGLCITNSKDQ